MLTLNPLNFNTPLFPVSPIDTVRTQQAPAPVFGGGSELAQLAALQGAFHTLGQGWQGFAGDGVVRVAVIDDFVAEQGGFNHGENIDGIITSNGAQTVRFNIDNGGNRNQNMAAALQQIAARAANGEQFDAVNISQQDFQANGNTEAVNRGIQLLQNNFGIPVVVAAGNNGANNANVLASGAAFVVENSALGQEGRAETSGVGNIRSEGEFTSQATANVSARVAQLKEQGLSPQQIQAALQAQAQEEGGSLNRPAQGQGPQTAQTQDTQQAQPQAEGAWTSHTIKAGETIWDLVVRQGGSTLDEFQKRNPNVNLDLYHPGTVIQIPPKKQSTSSGTTTPRSTNSSASTSSSPTTTSAPAPTPTPTPTRGRGGVNRTFI